MKHGMYDLHCTSCAIGGDTLHFQETETHAKKSTCVVSGKMASSMGGMFTGQQPSGSHPPTGPGGPGQPGLLTGPPGNRGTNNTLVDELEASFEVRSRKLLLLTSQ